MMYSPILWWTFIELVKILSGGSREETVLAPARRAAQEIMTIVVHNMPEFLPAVPKSSDFVKAFYNALLDFTGRPDLQKKYRFDPNALLKLLKAVVGDEAVKRRAMRPEEGGEVFKPYPYVTSVEDTIRSFTTDSTRFELGYSRGRQVFYQEYFNGIMALGHGVRFIRTSRGIQIIDARRQVTEDTETPPIFSAGAAWAKFKSLQTIDDVRKLLNPERGYRTVRPEEAEEVLAIINSLRQLSMPPWDLVYVAGKRNPQYMFETRRVTVFVDAVNGEINLARQRFY